MCELQSAVTIRKDLLIEKEMAALAKCRNVSINEIDRDELERKELSAENNMTENSLNETSKTPSAVSGCVFGKMPNENDLEAILRQRKNFTVANKSCDNFGDISDNEII